MSEDGSVVDGEHTVSVTTEETSPAPQVSASNQEQPSLSTVQALGAATAFITIAVAVIYGVGAAFLGLKLWFLKDPVTPVLGQLPHDFLFIDAFSDVIIPGIIAGLVIYLLYEGLDSILWVRASRERLANLSRVRKITGNTDIKGLARIVGELAIAALLATLPLVFLHFVVRFIPGVIRPYWEIYLLCLVLSWASIHLAFYILPEFKEYEQARLAQKPDDVRSRVLRKVSRIGMAALALIPCVAFVFAANGLDLVVACGSGFSHVDKYGRHYAIGNLIGTSGQWIYMAETRTRPLEQPGRSSIYIGSYIAVIPLSAVRLETIGQQAECNDLVPTGTHAH